MRPEVLADIIGQTIRGVVEPLREANRDQQKVIEALTGRIVVLEGVVREQASRLVELTDETKALGQHLVDTNALTPTQTRHRGTTH
jgi:hypothetical protein